MQAFIFTANASFEVILLCKDEISVLINVIVDVLLQHGSIKQLYKNSITEMLF